MNKNDAARLGLDLKAFNELADGRQTAALEDLVANRKDQEDKKYTEETLKTIFDEIVETRTVIQEAMKIYREANAEKPLDDIEFLTMVRDNLEGVSYKTISGEDVAETLKNMEKTEEEYDALEGKKVLLSKVNVTKETAEEAMDAQEAVFAKMGYDKGSFEAAAGDFETALKAVEDALEEAAKVTSVEAVIETEIKDSVVAGTVLEVKLTAKADGDEVQDKFNKLVPRIEVKHGTNNVTVLRNVQFEKGVATVEVEMTKENKTAGALGFSKIAEIENITTGEQKFKVTAAEMDVIKATEVEKEKVILEAKDAYGNEIDLTAENFLDGEIDGKNIFAEQVSEANTITGLDLEEGKTYTLKLKYNVGTEEEKAKTFEVEVKVPKAEKEDTEA